MQTVEHTQVETDVKVDGLLPVEVGVAESVDKHTGTEVVEHPVVVLIGRDRVEGTERLVTRVTDGATYLQHVEYVVGEVPSETNGPSGGKLTVGAEHRGAVQTVVDIKKIFVLIGISTVEVEVDSATLCLRIGWLAALCILVGKSGCGEVTFGESLSRKTFQLALILTD